MWFEALAPNTRVTARNMDRTRFTSWGVQNGRAGAPSYFLLNPNTNEERNLGNLDFIKISWYRVYLCIELDFCYYLFAVPNYRNDL